MLNTEEIRNKEVINIYDRKSMGFVCDIEINLKEGRIDGIVLPGGMPGTLQLGDHERVNGIIREFAEQKKLVAAICAAPSVLGAAGILEGKTAVCHPGFEGELKGANVIYENVAVDENIITSRGMGTAFDFGLAIVSYFMDDEVVADVRTHMIY